MKLFQCGIYLMAFLFVSCSGWNSELDTAFIDDGKSLQKPQCQFKLKKNCWSRSVELLMACVQPVVAEKELFTEDMRLCSNETGKRVVFVNPLELIGNFEEQSLQFNIYNGRKKCFRFSGQQENFKIDQNAFGSLEVTTLENGDTHVSCFFNESYIIPAEAKEKGCRGEKAQVAEFMPQTSLKLAVKTLPGGKEVTDNFSFYFSGAGVQTEPVFQCYL